LMFWKARNKKLLLFSHSRCRSVMQDHEPVSIERLSGRLSSHQTHTEYGCATRSCQLVLPRELEADTRQPCLSAPLSEFISCSMSARAFATSQLAGPIATYFSASAFLFASFFLYPLSAPCQVYTQSSFETRRLHYSAGNSSHRGVYTIFAVATIVRQYHNSQRDQRLLCGEMGV
jgi:hypothetical protein